MKGTAAWAVVLLFLGLGMGVGWAGEKTVHWESARSLVPGGVQEAWQPAQEGFTGWEILPLGVVEITTQELTAISGGGLVGVPGSGDAPGKIILWDEFRLQDTSTGVQTGNCGGACRGSQQNLITAVGR